MITGTWLAKGPSSVVETRITKGFACMNAIAAAWSRRTKCSGMYKGDFLSPLRGLFILCGQPTAYAVGCILSPASRLSFPLVRGRGLRHLIKSGARFRVAAGQPGRGRRRRPGWRLRRARGERRRRRCPVVRRLQCLRRGNRGGVLSRRGRPRWIRDEGEPQRLKPVAFVAWYRHD